MGVEELLEFSSMKEKRKESLEIITVLEDELDNFFWELNTNSQYNKDQYGGEIEKGFHPSGIVGDVECFRELIYGYLGVPGDDPEKIEPKLRRIFDNGSDLHDRWQRYFTMLSQTSDRIQLIGDWKCKGCGYQVSPDKERECPDFPCPTCGSTRWKYNEFRLRHAQLKLTGKRDLKVLIDGEPYLGEIKSINTFQFQKLANPLEKHIIQFFLYMLMDGTKKGFFLYEDKNTQAFKLMFVTYDSTVLVPIIEMLEIAGEFIDKEILPERIASYPDSKKCKLCGYRKLCQGDQSFKELADLMQ